MELIGLALAFVGLHQLETGLASMGALLLLVRLA